MQNGKPAPSHDRKRFPSLREDIGEDPARWLDRDLVTPECRKVQVSRDRSRSPADVRLVPDRAVSSGEAFVRARIRGIDRIAVCRAWRAVERALGRGPDGGPRERIIALLEQRERELEDIGERPDRLEHGPWPSCDCCDGESLSAEDLREQRAQKRSKAGSLTTDKSKGGAKTSSSASTLSEFATDGGRDD